MPVHNPAMHALGLLTLVYLFNYLDRTLIYILFQPIRAELPLSDMQLALLGSTSFVLFYTALGLPFGRLADRVSRTRMIAAGLLLWSAASALTGAMHGFYGMFACRVVVGIGEATLGPAALSLLADLYAPRRRATASAIFTAGIPVGAGLALLVGAAIAARWGWRAAFLCCGLPGVALAGVVLLLREPARGARDTAPAAAPEPAARALLLLWRSPGLVRLVLGYALLALSAQALSMWVPTLLGRVHGLPLPRAGLLCGLITAACGLVGVVGGGLIGDRLRARTPAGRVHATAAFALLCAPLWLALLSARSVAGVLIPFGGLTALALAWLGPAAAEVQERAGAARRGLGVGAYFFVVNLIGYGLGPVLIGRLSDLLGGARGVQGALLLCPAAALGATALLASQAGGTTRRSMNVNIASTTSASTAAGTAPSSSSPQSCSRIPARIG
jgi:MFS family permease